MEKKYRVLRIVASIFEILAWIVLVLGLLGAILFVVGTVAAGLGRLGARIPLRLYYQYMGMPAVSGLVGAIVMGLGSILYFLFLYATGELIYLLLDIEQNTRETAYHLKPKM